MEGDDEVKGQGNSYTTEFRQYDPRVGRWLSIDPMARSFPWQSPYVAFNNNPIIFVDPAGDSSVNEISSFPGIKVKKTRVERKIERIKNRFETRYDRFQRRNNNFPDQQVAYDAFKASSNRNRRLTQTYEDNVKSGGTNWVKRSVRNVRIRGGGMRSGTSSQTVDLVANTGVLRINYNMQSVPDRIVVTAADGTMIFDSGFQSGGGVGPNSTGSTRNIRLTGSTVINVAVNGGAPVKGSVFSYNIRFTPTNGVETITPEDAEQNKKRWKIK